MNPKALHKISYGMYVICSRNSEKMNGQIANALFQITAVPAMIAVGINKQNLTHEYIEKSNIFTVSILSESTPMSFIGNFGFRSGRDVNKFKDVEYKLGKTKLPIVLDNALAYIEARVIDRIDVSTHTIFIGEVEDAEILSEDKPMTYEYYHKIKGGVSPKTAPTYMEIADKTMKKDERRMEKYVCKVCGYVYDPEKGDPDGGIAPGTKFEDIPDDWVCPICGVSKENFKKEE